MSDVRTISDVVAHMGREWPMIRALLGGTSAMRAEGRKYLPQWPNEDRESYDARLAVATLYPAFSRTVEILAAKPFAKPLQLSESAPEKIREWMDNCDLQGRNLHTFASDVMVDCMAYGVSGVLVEYPTTSNVRSLADERASGARPYLVRYAPGSVLGWRMDGGRLTQLRLLETITEDDGEYGEDVVEQVRVLRPGSWQVFRGGESGWGLYDEGTTSLSEIPFVFFYGNRIAQGVGAPPMLNLAHINVEHWQSYSDQQTILHVARVPILALIGVDDGIAITVGSKSALRLPAGADVKYVEHSGAAISAGKEAIADLEERMRSTGAELLVIKQGDITATQTRSEDDGNKSALQKIAEGVEDALDQCLQYAAMWVGEADGGNVSLHKDFGAATLSDASAQLVVTMQQAGLITKETAIREQQRRGLLSPDIDIDAELDAVSNEGPALGDL